MREEAPRHDGTSLLTDPTSIRGSSKRLTLALRGKWFYTLWRIAYLEKDLSQISRMFPPPPLGISWVAELDVLGLTRCA